MSGEVVIKVMIHYPECPAKEFQVALVLAAHATHQGTRVFPGVPRISAMARCDRRTVQRALRKMEADGFLVLVKKGAWRNASNEYRIDLSWLLSQPHVAEALAHRNEERAEKMLQKGGNQGSKRAAKPPQKGGAIPPPNIININNYLEGDAALARLAAAKKMMRG